MPEHDFERRLRLEVARINYRIERKIGKVASYLGIDYHPRLRPTTQDQLKNYRRKTSETRITAEVVSDAHTIPESTTVFTLNDVIEGNPDIHSEMVVFNGKDPQKTKE